MIVLTPRARDLARHLLTSDGPLIIGDLAQKLKVSPRTIRYDLDVVSDWLRERHVLLQAKPRLGVWVQAEGADLTRCRRDLGSKDRSSTVFSSRERIYLALLLLLRCSAPISLATMAQRIGVSRSTLAGDLKQAIDLLKRWDMEIVGRPRLGLEIKGSERGRRELLAHVLVDLVAESELIRLLALSLQVDGHQSMSDLAALSGGWMSEEATLNMLTVGRIVREQLGTSLTDSSFVGLVVHLAVALERISHGQRIEFDPDYLTQLSKTPEFQISQELADRLGKVTGSDIPRAEIGYISLHLLGCRLRHRENQALSVDDHALTQRIREFVSSIEAQLGVRLEADLELRNGLYLHLRQLLTRIQYGLLESNPLTDQIRAQYPLLFASVLAAALGSLGLGPIDDDEAAFLTMHVGAALERQMNPKVCRVLVACSTGEGSAGLLAARLKHEFPSLYILARVSTLDAAHAASVGRVDLIISTLPLPNVSVPVAVVSPLLAPEETRHVQQAISRAMPAEGFATHPHHPAMWAGELSQLLTGVTSPAEMRPIIEGYLESKLSSQPISPFASLPLEKRLDPVLTTFVQQLAVSTDSPLSPDRVVGLTLHIAFAMDRWRQGEFIHEDDVQHQRYERLAPGLLFIVWNSLDRLAQECGIPSPPIDEAIPVMRYLRTA